MTADPTAAKLPGNAPQSTESVPSSPLKRPEVRILLVSRLATAIGLTTLSYGAMVYLAQQEASQFTISLVGATRYLAAVLFGMQGGIVADTTSKRTALLLGYSTMAGICLLVPALLGSGVPALLLLVFAISVIGQVVSPALKASVALVATAAEVAAVAAILSVAGGIGTAAGAAFLAPLLISLGGIQVVMYVAGAILILGAVRTIKLPTTEGGVSMGRALRQVDWRRSMPSLRKTGEWIMDHRTVALMALVGAMVVAIFDGLNTLMPVYVRDVLGVDPALTVFIFAPGGLGFLIGIILGPRMMRHGGERPLAAVGLIATAAGAVLFGLADLLSPLLAPISPLRLLTMMGVELNDRILTAGLIAVPFSFGSTLAGSAVQTYINRQVPVERQGAVFGMQELLENALVLVSILAFGLFATIAGIKTAFALAGPFVILIVIWLIRDSYREDQRIAPSRRAVFDSLVRPSRDDDPSDEAEARPPGETAGERPPR